LPQKAHEETDDASAGQGYTVCMAPSPMGVVLPAWVMSYWYTGTVSLWGGQTTAAPAARRRRRGTWGLLSCPWHDRIRVCA